MTLLLTAGGVFFAQRAYADTVVYTISDGSMTPSLVSGACDTSQVNTTPSDGAQGTVLSSACTGRNDAPNVKWIKTVTWLTMGVPSGATVTAVDGSYKYRQAAETNAATETMGALQLKDSGDTAACAASDVEVSFDPTPTSASYSTRNASSTVNVSAGCQAAATSITIRLNMIPATGNSASANSELRADDISLTITYTPADTSAPTPNPATFATPPRNDSTSSIYMAVTTSSDATTPIEYLFTFSACASDGGTGGSSSTWQQSTEHTDDGLQPNQCYKYTVTSRDSASPANTGTESSASSTYTSANTPGTPTLSGATTSTLNLANDANSNPSSNPTTKFAVKVVTTSPTDNSWLNKWVDSSGNPGASETWMSDATLDALVVRGLATSTTYGFQVKARNEDLEETSLGAEGQGTTTSGGGGGGGGGTNISSASTEHWAWNDTIGWMNFYDTNTVIVSSTRIQGYASSSAGDISLDCATTRAGDICSQSNYYVVNDGNGNLSGWGWNDTYGWISFYCGNHSGCATSNYRVYISSGVFYDYAWNDVVGWISFNCSNHSGCSSSDYKVVTTWTGTSTAAVLESTTIDTGVASGAQINSVLWRGNQPSGTVVRFQFAVSNSSNGPWTFKGSDGTASTYYTTDPDVAKPLDYQHHNNARYFRYRVELVSDSAQTLTPRIDDIVIDWSP